MGTSLQPKVAEQVEPSVPGYLRSLLFPAETKLAGVIREHAFQRAQSFKSVPSVRVAALLDRA